MQVSIYSHQLVNYRYHWHETEYELTIVLQGEASFSCGNDVFLLKEDDLIFIEPGISHASMALDPDTLALVLHFPESALDQLFSDSSYRIFPSFSSAGSDCRLEPYERLRFFTAQILGACRDVNSDGSVPAAARLQAKAGLLSLLSSLYRFFPWKQLVSIKTPEPLGRASTQKIISYLETHYMEKVTLEDLSQFTGYNRTYLSTFFKRHTRTNFSEYLNRLRFQNALQDLLLEKDKNLTSVAIDNGFSDLKAFTTRFRSTFHTTPAQYKAHILSATDPQILFQQRIYLSLCHPVVVNKLEVYGNPWKNEKTAIPTVFSRSQ